MLLEDILKEFIFECKIRKLSDRTIKSYKNNNLALFSYLKAEYGVVKIDDMTQFYLKGYIAYLSDKKLKETYINSIIKCIKAFLTYCVNEEYIKINPIDRISKQKEELPVITTFTNDEVARMIKYYGTSKFLDCRNQLIMVILFDTGIRNFELCNLTMDDIRDTYINIRGKGKKVRHVPITPTINKYMLKYIRLRDYYIKDKITYDIKYLFLSQKGRQLTVETIERVVKTCGQECKVREQIRISPHTCRHYFAQAQLMNGCDLFTVSKLLGHSNINITKRYLNSIQTDEILTMAVKTTPLSNLYN